MPRLFTLVFAVVLSLAGGCSRAPDPSGLRDSFAQQLAANKFISDFQRQGDDLTFRGPRPDGVPATWRVHIDSAVVEAQSGGSLPYKGTVTSSWYVDGEKIESAGTESNLPIELTSNGLGQECWAFWEADRRIWTWE